MWPYFEQIKGMGSTEVVGGELADILHTSEVGLSLFSPRKSPPVSPKLCGPAQLPSPNSEGRSYGAALLQRSIHTDVQLTDEKKKKLTDIAGPADRMLWLGFFYFCFIFFFFFFLSFFFFARSGGHKLIRALIASARRIQAPF